MEGYEVLTSDDRHVGTVVARRGSWLIVETGRLRHARHALPKEFAHPDDAARQVHITLPRELLDESPQTDVDGNFDQREAELHYGLATPPDASAGDALPQADEHQAHTDADEVEVDEYPASSTPVDPGLR